MLMDRLRCLNLNKECKFLVLSELIIIFARCIYHSYLDLALTHYYVLALHDNQPCYICYPLKDRIDNLLVYQEKEHDFTCIGEIYLPPSSYVVLKSLIRSYPRNDEMSCFVFFAHNEGFVPGSLEIIAPLYHEKWTLSYAGSLRSSYSPLESISDRD